MNKPPKLYSTLFGSQMQLTDFNQYSYTTALGQKLDLKVAVQIMLTTEYVYPYTATLLSMLHLYIVHRPPWHAQQSIYSAAVNLSKQFPDPLSAHQNVDREESSKAVSQVGLQLQLK